MLESRIYHLAVRATDLFVLNLLWLLVSLPVVTLFPATAAVFGVVREWQVHEGSGAVTPFARQLRAHFRTAFLLGLVWLPLGGLVALNFAIVLRIEGPPSLVLLSTNLFGALVYLFISVYLFPLLVHLRLPALRLIQYGLYFSIGYLRTTSQAVAVLAAFLVLAFVLPASILISGAPAAYAIYRLCRPALPGGGEDRSTIDG